MNTRQTKPLSPPSSALPKSGVFDKAPLSLPANGQGNPGGQEQPDAVRSRFSLFGATGGRPRLPVDMAKAKEFLAHGYSIKSTAQQMNLG